MEKILGQQEIDALFAQMNTVAETSAEPAPPACDAFNFSRAGQISTEQMRAIATVNDLFARNLMHTVGAWLRTELNVNMVSGEQMPYSEYVERVPDPMFVCSLRLEPLGAVGVLEVDLALVAPMVDLLLGGTGMSLPPRPLTDIEELILTSVVQIIVKEFNVAWEPVGLQVIFEKRETAAQIPRIMPGSEQALCVSFEVRMPHVQGMLNLCLPAVVLNATLRSLISERVRPRRRAAEVRNRVRELVSGARVGAVLQFPAMRLKAREIAALVPGSVLRLPLPRHAAAELRIAGQSFGQARPVRVGEHRGARMEAADSSVLAASEDAKQAA